MVGWKQMMLTVMVASLQCNARVLAFMNAYGTSTKIRARNNDQKLIVNHCSHTLPGLLKWHSTALNQNTNPSAANDGNVKGSPSTNPYFIPTDQLERLKGTVDIVSVVESYGLPQFQRKGDNKAIAVCPFHNDRNPSLNIDGDRRIYKCFSCGAGGDVFNFVREYSALRDGEEAKLNFAQAVRHVAKEFGDPSISIGDYESPSSTKGKNRMSEEERRKIDAKKKRLMLANAAAAAYYGECLMTLPSAGQGRSYLIDRGLSPTTVRKFAIGYAPDAYFESKRSNWGKGSLVHRLREMKFTPDEIIDAGLATRTKRGRQEDILEKGAISATENATNTINMDYSTLMDRFRGRLMVPIFDSTGKQVLGFGGRILPQKEESKDSKFKAPKYLNSPESLVFHKSHVLFGQHNAREAVTHAKSKPSPSSEANKLRRNEGEIVIVEGYLDAISLSEAGVDEVVACMGTALTAEQLASAAITAGTRGGKCSSTESVGDGNVFTCRTLKECELDISLQGE